MTKVQPGEQRTCKRCGWTGPGTQGGYWKCRPCVYARRPRTYSRLRIPDDQIVPYFWSKVDKDGPIPPHRPALGPCWIWTGYCKPNGYGSFALHRVATHAHRFAFAQEYGPIPIGKHVLHKCDNPPCVRPTHLFLGTAKDNMDDCREKGRAPVGERAGGARLRNSQIAAIRALVFSMGAITRPEKVLLAEAVGVSTSHLDDILSNRKRQYG